MKKILTKSENFNQEYCATVVRIGEVTPIEGSDFLGKVIIEGQSVVVRKDVIKTGDVMVYAANETVLNHDFLRVNNEFELSERQRNDNYEEVEDLIKQRDEKRKAIAKLRKDVAIEKKTIAQLEEDTVTDHTSELELHKGKLEEFNTALAVYEKAEAELEAAAKSKVGFFNKHGRVKMITLRKCPSFGYLITIDSLAKAFPEVKDIDWQTLADGPVEERDFDTINDVLFIKVYVPYVPPVNERVTGEKKRNKRLKKFDRMIPGQFSFHYDTAPLNKNMYRIEPDDKVTISVKLHGCVDADTIVNTDHGDFTIKHIIDNKLSYKIKAFDIDRQKEIYVNIDDYYHIPNDGEWYKITLEDGTELIITGNNPVWLPELNCYRRTDELKIGDVLLKNK